MKQVNKFFAVVLAIITAVIGFIVITLGFDNSSPGTLVFGLFLMVLSLFSVRLATATRISTGVKNG